MESRHQDAHCNLRGGALRASRMDARKAATARTECSPYLGLEQTPKKHSRRLGGSVFVRAGFSIHAHGRDKARPSQNGQRDVTGAATLFAERYFRLKKLPSSRHFSPPGTPHLFPTLSSNRTVGRSWKTVGKRGGGKHVFPWSEKKKNPRKPGVERVVGDTELESVTSCMSSKRSNQLS